MKTNGTYRPAFLWIPFLGATVVAVSSFVLLDTILPLVGIAKADSVIGFIDQYLGIQIVQSSQAIQQALGC
jgi:hypothetical protein